MKNLAALVLVITALAPTRVLALPLTFLWDANTDGVTVRYRLMGNHGTGYSPLAISEGVLNTTATVDVTLAASWTFYVVAISLDGAESDPSNVVSYNPLALPPALAVTHTTTYNGAQRWTAAFTWPAPAASFAVTNYTGTLSRSDGTTVLTFSTASPNVAFNGLPAGQYLFQGWAVNAAGPGPVTVRAVPIVRPGPPKNFRRGP